MNETTTIFSLSEINVILAALRHIQPFVEAHGVDLPWDIYNILTDTSVSTSKLAVHAVRFVAAVVSQATTSKSTLMVHFRPSPAMNAAMHGLMCTHSRASRCCNEAV